MSGGQLGTAYGEGLRAVILLGNALASSLPSWLMCCDELVLGNLHAVKAKNDVTVCPLGPCAGDDTAL